MEPPRCARVDIDLSVSVFGAAEKKEVGRPPDVRRYRPAVRADVPFTPFSDDDKGTSSFLPPPLAELYLLEVYLLRASFS